MIKPTITIAALLLSGAAVATQIQLPGGLDYGGGYTSHDRAQQYCAGYVAGYQATNGGGYPACYGGSVPSGADAYSYGYQKGARAGEAARASQNHPNGQCPNRPGGICDWQRGNYGGGLW